MSEISQLNRLKENCHVEIEFLFNGLVHPAIIQRFKGRAFLETSIPELNGNDIEDYGGSRLKYNYTWELSFPLSSCWKEGYKPVSIKTDLRGLLEEVKTTSVIMHVDHTSEFIDEIQFLIIDDEHSEYEKTIHVRAVLDKILENGKKKPV